jgi:hypothetical protein
MELFIYLEDKPQTDYLRSQQLVRTTLLCLLDHQIQQYRKALALVLRLTLLIRRYGLLILQLAPKSSKYYD